MNTFGLFYGFSFIWIKEEKNHGITEAVCD